MSNEVYLPIRAYFKKQCVDCTDFSHYKGRALEEKEKNAQLYQIFFKPKYLALLDFKNSL